ncbi:uncharacterized protein LOC129350328 isoform X2 [Amphiprion ocellaris]|uniref:uncharacterized protein LOC129350328 isoform X2 n=1 Tax=Amphiprion ocellaris TaxID=80972 RepID=UPI002411025B|nr:uncharacterized protein LOC129350328 isoform X2 [Amphiprion ocellaris]
MTQTQLDCVLHDADLCPPEVECSESVLDIEYLPPQTPPSPSDKEDLKSPNQSQKLSTEEAVKGSDTNSSADGDQQRGMCNFQRQKDPTTYVKRKNKKQNGNQKVRVYRRYFCLYCGKPSTKMARHLQHKHMEQKDVAYAFSFPLGSKQRKVLLGQLRNLGDFKHNAIVLAKGRGDLVTWQHLSDKASVQDYMPGSFCSGIFAGILAENPCLCARPGVKTNIRDCLGKYTKESKAENPELLRSAKLRKNVATLCKLLDLCEQLLEQVARFMGHCTLQKISKPPFGMEQGMATLSGRNLNTLDPSACGIYAHLVLLNTISLTVIYS